MTSLSLGSRTIGPGQPTFVIAEIGVNHDGSVARALELVQHAHSAGADAIKLQLFHAKALLHPSAAFAEYQKDRCAEPTPADMLGRYELSARDVGEIVSAIRAAGMIPLATPFSPSDIETLAAVDLPAIKIASPDIVNLPLLKRAAELRKPLLISTGAATMDEVAAAVDWLRLRGVKFALLHCISSYPVPADDANLCWIRELSVFGAPVGFSDHTTEQLGGALAVAAGACLVEKHLTYDRSAPGPDHAASADPQQFAAYVAAIRLADRLKGTPGKRVLPIENEIRQMSRQSLVLRRDLSPDQQFAENDLTTQRPASGISPFEIDQVLTRRPKRPLPAGTILHWEMLS